MKAYIQTNAQGQYYNVNAFQAAIGFEHLGFEIIPYHQLENIQESDPEAVFVGGVGMIRKRLAQLGIQHEAELEYPPELTGFLNRKVWSANLQDLICTQTTDLFVKPKQTKLFPGKLIRNFRDYIGLNFEETVPVWCSEIVAVVTEWRCFVRYGSLLDVRYYKGCWDSRLDLTVVEAAIEAFTEQPAAYCLDFGVDATGNYYLIEANDGHSLGSYGMGAVSYAKFLSARWAELTQTKDWLHF